MNKTIAVFHSRLMDVDKLKEILLSNNATIIEEVEHNVYGIYRNPEEAKRTLWIYDIAVEFPSIAAMNRVFRRIDMQVSSKRSTYTKEYNLEKYGTVNIAWYESWYEGDKKYER